MGGSRLDLDRSIVVAIDFQGKLMELVHRPDLLVENSRRLLRLAEIFEVPVVLTEQYPAGLGSTDPRLAELFEELRIPKRRVEKTTFGCCGEPAFLAALEELRPVSGRRQVVVAGIEAHICVLQTVLALLESDHEVFLCWECTSSRGAETWSRALERMRDAGAILTNHESVGFEWAVHKDHPAFRAMNRLFRGHQLP